MNTTTINAIRKKIKENIDFADDKTVKMIYAMMEVEQNEDTWTDPEFIAEMDRRAKEYEAGTARLFSLAEMEENAREAYKLRKNARL